MSMFKIKLGRWFLAVKWIPIVLGVLIAKVVLHQFGLEFLELNALFTSLIGATTFLLGFLITGVLTDYKESEKLPGEITSSLAVLSDESTIIYKAKGSKDASEFLKYQLDFVKSFKAWMYKKIQTSDMHEKLDGMNEFFLKLESQAQIAFIGRMKAEQSVLRKAITRINTIKETGFVGTAYVIAELLGTFVVFGMIVLKMQPFYVSLAFVSLVTFLVWYMIFLIRDLDDPFEYDSHGESGTEISLKPIHDYEARLEAHLKKLNIE
jgi:hypothetical protein